ncbi:MAG: Maf family protein [Pseudomonadota bacterium]
MNSPITLASGSASRQSLLKGAGIVADAIKSGVDEDALKDQMRGAELTVAQQAMRLAMEKATAVSGSRPGLVIGGDQMLALGARAFDKPIGIEGVKEHLKDLSGKTHILETAIVVAEDGEVIWEHLERPQLTMRELSDDFIDYYVGQVGTAVCDTVGGYQLEGLGVQLFSRIEGDYFSILGLPLLALLEFFRSHEVIEA